MFTAGGGLYIRQTLDGLLRVLVWSRLAAARGDRPRATLALAPASSLPSRPALARRASRRFLRAMEVLVRNQLTQWGAALAAAGDPA
jgi:hypothetical protein